MYKIIDQLPPLHNALSDLITYPTWNKIANTINLIVSDNLSRGTEQAVTYSIWNAINSEKHNDITH